MNLRLDKFLWVTRLVKTRSLGTELIQKKKVMCNGVFIKPSKEVKLGDELKLQEANAWFTYKVVGLIDKRVGANKVNELIIDLTPKEEIQKLLEYKASQKSFNHLGSGNSSKRSRRLLNQFLEEASEEGEEY